MSGTLSFRNRHPTRRVDLRLLRRIVQALLREAQPNGSYDLGVCLLAAPRMTRINETFLQHQGSTDVITFNYAEPSAPESLHGEIVVCLDEAASQARRFHTTWQSETIRYVVHGVLHLLGYEDQDASARRHMRAAEDALVHRLAQQFAFRGLSRPRTHRRTSRPRRMAGLVRPKSASNRGTIEE